MTEPLWLTGGRNYPQYGCGWDSSNSPCFHETWYIPRDPETGTGPLYRLFSGSLLDHMDAWYTSASPDYNYEFTLGYPWTSQKSGTKPLTRYIRTSIWDHRTWLRDETPAGYTVDAVLDTNSGVPRYGYQRFGLALGKCSVLRNAYREWLDNGTLHVDLNRVWGNAIGRIYAAGRQIVGGEDIGEMVQSTIFIGADDFNPTESGGVDRWNYGNTTRWSGSPIISTGGWAQYHSTTVRPTNFQGYTWAGTDGYTALLWKGTFQKNLTLGYTAGQTAYPDVLKITFGASLDPSVDPGFYTGAGMNNTLWLYRDTAVLGDNLRVDIVDLTTNTVILTDTPTIVDQSVWVCNPDITTPNSNERVLLQGACPAHLGIIAYGSDSTLAYGLKRRDSTGDAPHALKFFLHCSGSCTAPGHAEIVFDTYKTRSLSSTYTYDTVYFIPSGLTSVRQRLRQIYCQDTGQCTP